MDAAASGDTISIGVGSFAENIVIGTNIVLQGAGSTVTTVRGEFASVLTVQPNIQVWRHWADDHEWSQHARWRDFE